MIFVKRFSSSEGISGCKRLIDTMLQNFMFANSVTYFPVTGYNIALQTTGTLTSLLWISACGVKPLELPATVMHLIRDKS